jgi:hypothetical protein
VIGRDVNGAETWTLTGKGVQLAHRLAMSSEDGGEELLGALLDRGRRGIPRTGSPRGAGENFLPAGI